MAHLKKWRNKKMTYLLRVDDPGLAVHGPEDGHHSDELDPGETERRIKRCLRIDDHGVSSNDLKNIKLLILWT